MTLAAWIILSSMWGGLTGAAVAIMFIQNERKQACKMYKNRLEENK
jgi:hypothetical protein